MVPYRSGKLYPVDFRLAALSELGWADPEQHDFDAFMDRLYRLITVYDKSHYTYSEHVFQITENFRTDTLQDALEISLSTIGNRPIYYTTDGSQLDTASLIYTEPLIIREDTILPARWHPLRLLLLRR